MKIEIVMGAHDSPEFQRQSLSFYEQLKGVFKMNNLDIFISLDDDHFTIVENLADESSDSGKHLKKFLQHFSKVKTL